MRWVRCPKCRTVNDVDRYLQCDGCDGDLAGVPTVENPRRQEVQWAGDRDSRTGGGVGWVIALLALGSTFVLPAGVSVLSALVSFVMLFTLFMKSGLRHITGSRMGMLFKIGGALLAILGALVGALILVAIACSVNLSGVRFGG